MQSGLPLRRFHNMNAARARSALLELLGLGIVSLATHGEVYG
jgi:hypothetical protein